MNEQEWGIHQQNKSQIIDEPSAELYKRKIRTYGNIWVREIKLNKNEKKEGHKHPFDHLHFLSNGRALVTVYDIHDPTKILLQKEYTAPAWIKVPKEHFHDIQALEDNTLGYCIQALHNLEGNVIATDYVNDPDWMYEVKKFEEENGMNDETLK